MNWWPIFAALLVIAAIVLYEIHNAIRMADMWAQLERDQYEDGGP